MAKPSIDDIQRSSAIESGSGKLEIRNDLAISQVRTVLATQNSLMDPETRTLIQHWCREEEGKNKDTQGEYKLAWKKFEEILTEDQGLRIHFLAGCPDFKEYVEAVESGQIVPSPTPPPASVIVTRRSEIQKGVAGIYGHRRPTPKPAPPEPEAPQEEPAVSSRRSSRKMRAGK